MPYSQKFIDKYSEWDFNSCLLIIRMPYSQKFIDKYSEWDFNS